MKLYLILLEVNKTTMAKFSCFILSRVSISCNRRYSQSEDGKAVVYLTVWHPTLLPWAVLYRINCLNYPAELVDKQFDKALSISRSELLSKKVKPDKKVFPLVLDYNPILPDIQKVIKKHFHLLQSSPEVKEIFPSKSIFPAYRRTKNLKEMLAPSKFQATSCRNQREESGGCSKCDKKCDLCKNYLIQASKFQSSATGRHYPIQQIIIIYRFLERHILKALWRFTIMKINKKLQKTIKSLFKKKGLKAPFECV